MPDFVRPSPRAHWAFEEKLDWVGMLGIVLLLAVELKNNLITQWQELESYLDFLSS